MSFDPSDVVFVLALAIWLHRERLVSMSHLPWRELGKAVFTAMFAGVLSYGVAQAVKVTESRLSDLQALALISVTWAAAVATGLWATGSELPVSLRRRGQRTSYPHVAEKHAEDMR